MSDTTDPVLSALHTKRRELELDHVQLAGRILEINECIALIERGGARRSGRPRKDKGDLMQLCPDGIIRPVEAGTSARNTAQIETLNRVYGPETETGSAA